MKRLKTAVWVFLITLFQAVLVRYISIGEIKPDLLFIFVLVITAHEKNIGAVMKTAVVCGIIADCMTGRIFGNYLSVYLICSVVMFVVRESLFRGNIIIDFVLIFLSTVLGNSVFYIINIGVLKNAGYLYALFDIILPVAVYNTLLSAVMMYPVKKTIYKKAGVRY